MNIKEAADRQTMQNFTFPCCVFPLTYDIHLDKEIDISCALIQHDLQQEDSSNCFVFASCLAALLDMTWTMTL